MPSFFATENIIEVKYDKTRLINAKFSRCSFYPIWESLSAPIIRLVKYNLYCFYIYFYCNIIYF